MTCTPLRGSRVVKFVGLEDAIIYSMGFATNSTIISALAVIISDEVKSCFDPIWNQARWCECWDVQARYEALLEEVNSQGQPKTHRPRKKIVLTVEGLYSTEGTSVNLPGSSSLPFFFG